MSSKKIKIGKLNFINKLSFMAKNLNQKLCEVNPSWRYSANLAIKHPWITRNPNDEIPLTFNEILNRNNCKKNWNHLIMTCIFLNYYKKKEIKSREKGKESKLYINNFIKKKRNKLYYITKKYVNKCNIISEKEKEKYLKRRERCLEVESTEEEDSIEKEQVTIANKNKRNSIKKDTNKFNSMERNYKEDLYLNNNLLSPKLNINKTKKKFTINSKPTKLNDNTIFNNNKKCIGSSKSIYIFSTPNDENDNNKYKHQNSGEIKLKNKINQNNINSNNLNSNTNRASCKSISKFNINTIVKKEQLPKDIKRVSLIQKTPKYNYNLPNVSKSGKINNIHVNINTTSKKQYSNNNVRNYNIIPLVLPFIKI